MMRASLAPLGAVLIVAALLPAGPALAQQQPGAKPANPAAPAARPAPALPRPARFSVGLSGGYQPSTTEFDDSFSFPLHQETGTIRSRYSVGGGALLDGSFGIRLWDRLGVGVAVSRFQVDASVAGSSSVPHPFFLDRHRSVEGEAGGLRRTETALHVQAQYTLPLRRPLQVTVMGGPSLLQAEQALVLDVNYAEEYPYDTATFTGVDSAGRSASAAGFNVGVDVRYMFSRVAGVGGLVRFTRATVQLDAADGRTVAVDAGGAQAGVGLRFEFDRRRAPAPPRR